MKALPDVTVVVGAYNAVPYVERCLRSVAEQTLGMDRLEVVAVDDGSTDGTGAVLDSFAARYPDSVRVVHQPNSGGPSGPRNRGLDLATGRYVFFLDADDHLGDEALERMLAMAEQQGSDVVLGKVASVNGRGVPKTMFRRTQPRADLFDSRVWWTLTAHKLFRLDHVRRLRFPTEYRIGEDQMFSGRALLTARVISVVADYDCYYLRLREDGGNITAVDRDLVARMRMLTRMCAMVAEHVPAGPRRDHLLHRQFGIDLASWCGPRILGESSEVRDQVLALAAEVIRTWASEELLRRLPALVRLRCHLIARGLFEQALEVLRFEESGEVPATVVEHGVVHAVYPYWRDPVVKMPDDVFDITARVHATHRLDALELSGSGVRLRGRAALEEVAGPASVEVLLRERGTRREVRVAAEPRGEEFLADFDLATADGGGPLTRGLWDVFLLVTVRGVRREVRFGSERPAGLETRTRTRVVVLGAQGPTAVKAYYTDPYGNLTFDVAEAAHRAERIVRVDVARWARPGTLAVHGVADDEIADGALAIRLRAASGEERDHPARVRGGRFSALVPAAELAPGTWSVSARLALSSGAREVPVPAAGLPATRWRRGLRLLSAGPAGPGGPLLLRVAPVPVAAWRPRRAGGRADGPAVSP